MRNYIKYGGLIVIDTTGPINLWFSNTDEERGAVLATVWHSSPNPVERQRFASRQAWAAISAEPARFGRKLVEEGLGAWGPRSFTVRRDFWADFLQRPRAGALLAQLDTLAALVTLPLALLGLLFAPRASSGAAGYRLTIAALAACYTFMIAATHFEGRYRTPFLLLLLPYAAWCLAHPRQLLAALRRPAGLAALALTAALALYYSPAVWPAQLHSARALTLHGRGLLRAAWGDPAGALADQRAAFALQPTLREAGLAAALLAGQRGDASAERELSALLQAAHADDDDAPALIVALQRLLLAQGRSEQAAALDRGLSIPGRRRTEALAWRRLGAPQPELRIGTNDLGLTHGFYARQTSDDVTFRWSRPHARLLLAGSGAHICLRLNAARPHHRPAPAIALSAASNGGRNLALGTLTPPRTGWAWACAPAPPDRSVAPFELHLDTPRYNPYLAGIDSDTRDLGVALAEVRLLNGPLSIDPTSGLLLDRLPTGSTATERAGEPPPLELIGITGALRGRPGTLLPLTLWWRGARPPTGAYTFLHLLDANGATVAAYNAPLAAGLLPDPWLPGEPLPDQTALPLPAGLAPGPYHLQAGAFDPTTGAVLANADFGTLEITR
jgi:hypothetical protein